MLHSNIRAKCVASALLFLVSPVVVASSARAAETALVRIDNFTFQPATLTVKAGTIVTFENDDDIPHLVVANDGSFRSKAMDTGDAFRLTAGKPGTYPYFCGLHPHMQGEIKVTP